MADLCRHGVPLHVTCRRCALARPPQHEQPALLEDQLALPFGGVTYEPEVDGKRLARQLTAVRTVMGDGEWRTLSELAAIVGAPEASVSARLRDLRKPAFGEYVVERRRKTGGGWWEYRVLQPVEADT